MPRGTSNPSEVFREIIAAAKKELLAKVASSSAYKHPGIKGDERAAALANFLKPRLPGTFSQGKGEAIDCFGNRTGQIDLAIYDHGLSVPLSFDSENVLLPCEALYSVIEVKSLLTRKEVASCLNAAIKVRNLRPFKRQFVGPHKNGEPAPPGDSRCMYVVFAFETDLSDEEWAQSEMRRMIEVGAELSVSPGVIERVVILDRGLLNPCEQVAKAAAGANDEIFLEFYVHLMNFLARESRRRPGLDLQNYSAKTSKGWVKVPEE